MENNKSMVRARSIFFALTMILSCLTMNSDKLSGYLKSQGTVFIIFRLTLIGCFMFIATLMNKNNLKVISKIESTTVIIITVLIIFDYYVTEISGSQFLFRVWWMVSVFMAELVLFITVTILSKKDKEYEKFCKRFWIAFTPLYIFVLILCFARNPQEHNLSVNTQLGQGTFIMLKAFLRNPNTTFEAPLIFFGNMLIFAPMPYILKSFIKKISIGWLVAIGIAIPFFIEGYQYIFSCGNVDIDDIVLNIFGYMIGLIFLVITNKKLINKQP